MRFDTEQEAIDYVEENGVDRFDGMNCNDYLGFGDEECAGWDGETRRCYCGNRRVELLTSQDSDGKWTAYGRAY
jgi:hypothetical protein